MKKSILQKASPPHAPKAKTIRMEGRTERHGTYSALALLREGDL